MAPKHRSPASTTPTPSSASHSSPTSTTPSSSKSSSSSKPNTPTHTLDAQQIITSIWRKYLSQTPQRVKLLDAFMGFLVVVAVLQFIYVVLVGNFPFNAFLSGFSATVGQFVLTASLRIQTNPDNGREFADLSHERAFADYVLGSLLLHFFCVNFIN
ncbi:defender against death DAD protein [Westerdykella ornata]|uniref:Dolichyl-diphosphooligosaccharide--protein glycosyltransferase subunit OST2 n=1 Tax=Westerdykella ornata TaxID=318751 RepID=A0A6A6JY20_WESOR|nr:defender against death DAD protein [Westerdykella ornata]KAF2281307.1 defender against death DAD protein [Westerdykella ornata]